MSSDPSKSGPHSPYRSIEPFRYVDRENYFGQVTGTQELYAKILLYRLVVLFGESGAGKSSLLNAALIPAMQKEGVRAERLRVRPDPEQPISVERIPTTERADTDFLSSIFVDNEAVASHERVITSSLEDFLPTVRAKAASARPLLIFDQFEELFTLFDQKGADAVQANLLQRSILDTLFQIVSDQNLPAKVVIVIREDFLGKLEVLARRYPQVLDHRVRLRYFTHQDATEAVVGAFRSAGRFPSRLTLDLAEEIARDLSGDVQDALVSPTQLQIICSRLWDTFSGKRPEIGVAEYRTLEGATGIVKGFFESELQQVAPGLRPLAITILGSLITGSDTRDVVSEEKLRGLTVQHAASPEDVSSILGVLEARRLINKTSQRGTYFYEVSSEYLIAPIQKQRRKLAIQQATEEAEKKASEEAAEIAREAARALDLERARALAEAQRQRADVVAKSAKRLRFVVVALVLVLAFAVGVTIYALRRRQEALEFAAKSKVQANAAQLAQLEANKQSDLAQKNAAAALDSEKKAEAALQQAKIATDAERKKSQLAEANAQEAQVFKLAAQAASNPLPTNQSNPSSVIEPSQTPSQVHQAVKHVIVVMLENRSFDHMLGALKLVDSNIEGLTGNEYNPDSSGAKVLVRPTAAFQGQLDPDPDHRFQGVDLQVFGGQKGDGRQPNMQGFVQSYYQQQQNSSRSHNIMYYFSSDKLPVLTTLAREFAVCDHWFSSVPGPEAPNHAFASFGTSFGHVGTEFIRPTGPYASIYDRLLGAGRKSRIYMYDQSSSSMEIVALPNRPDLFATFQEFLADAKSGNLPDYSFVEPNYIDHLGADRNEELASDEHPDHHVQAGELFIARVYDAIFNNPALWNDSVLLITYSNHGGIYDHVPPPAATPDGFVAPADETRTGQPFAFDRLGVRVPAVIVSPYIPRGTVDHTVYEHASIPATISKLFLNNPQTVSPRERNANTFDRVLTLKAPRKDDEIPFFNIK